MLTRRNDVNVPVLLLLTLNRFHFLFYCFYRSLHFALLISFLSVSLNGSQNLKSLIFEILTRQLCQLASDNAQKQSPEVFYEKKVFLEISQNSQENTCARASILIKLQV